MDRNRSQAALSGNGADVIAHHAIGRRNRRGDRTSVEDITGSIIQERLAGVGTGDEYFSLLGAQRWVRSETGQRQAGHDVFGNFGFFHKSSNGVL